MKTPEGRVKDSITVWLGEIGAWYCMPVTGGWGRRLVDILSVIPSKPCPCCGRRGDFVAIETKRQGNVAKKFQERILEQVRAAGGYGFSVDSLDLLKERIDYVVRPKHQRPGLPDP